MTDGKRVWQRDLRADMGTEGPQWGFSSSPLVIDDKVLIYGGGEDGNSLVALRVGDGEHVWSADAGTPSYSSPQLALLRGQTQVLMFTGLGLASFAPDSGARLWVYEWLAADEMEGRIIQPTVISDRSILIGSESKSIRLDVSHQEADWLVSESWTSRHVKPDFNDFVCHNGHAFGFDGSLLCCIDLETGRRTWRQRGYGKGQLLLIMEQDLLSVLSETGQAAIVEATPERWRELSRTQLIEGKTWNHPVIASGRLYVRNSAEAACFQLPRRAAPNEEPQVRADEHR